MKLVASFLFSLAIRQALSLNFFTKTQSESTNEYNQNEKLFLSVDPIIQTSSPSRSGYHEIIIIDWTSQSDVSGFLKDLTQKIDVVVNTVITLDTIEAVAFQGKTPDFAIIIQDSFDKETLLKHDKFLRSTFLAASVKIMMISMLTNGKTKGTALKFNEYLFAQFTNRRYLNVIYMISSPEATSKFKKIYYSRGFIEISTDEHGFPMSSMGILHTDFLMVTAADALPYTMIHNGKVLGIAGKLLDAFCEKYKLDYRIVNKNTKRLNMKEFINSLANSDISLYIALNVQKTDWFDRIETSEFDGVCLLVPNNIPVTTYESFSFPFGKIVTLLYVLSIVLLTVLWKIFSHRRRSHFALNTIILSVYKLILGLGFENESQMNRAQRILVYSFIIGNMLMISLYQSWITSLMLSQPTMRSIQSIEEFNKSNTKIHTYLKEISLRFRDDLILNDSSYQDEGFVFKLPESYRDDLAYLVNCRYADEFERSARNIRDGEKVFIKMAEPLSITTLSLPYSTFFPMAKEFKFVVEALIESGIKDQWLEEAMEEEMTKMSLEEDKKTFLMLGDMKFPFTVLGFGAFAGFVSFIAELTLSFVSRRKMLRVKRIKKKRKTCNRKKGKEIATFEFLA